MIFKVKAGPHGGYFIGGGNCNYVHKDGKIVWNSTGYLDAGMPDDISLCTGYWKTHKEAEIFLAGWQVLNPLPKPDLSQVDYEPEYELGTRFITAKRRVYRYCKLDFGIVGQVDSDSQNWVETINYIQYRWFCVKL